MDSLHKNIRLFFVKILQELRNCELRKNGYQFRFLDAGKSQFSFFVLFRELLSVRQEACFLGVGLRGGLPVPENTSVAAFADRTPGSTRPDCVSGVPQT